MIFPSPQHSRRYAVEIVAAGNGDNVWLSAREREIYWVKCLTLLSPSHIPRDLQRPAFISRAVQNKPRCMRPSTYQAKFEVSGLGLCSLENLQVTNLRNLSFRAPPPGRLVQLLRAIAQSRTCSSLTQIPPPPTCRSGCASQGGSQHYGFQAMRIGYCCKPTRVYPKNWSIPIAAIAGFGRCLLEVA